VSLFQRWDSFPRGIRRPCADLDATSQSVRKDGHAVAPDVSAVRTDLTAIARLIGNAGSDSATDQYRLSH
jgi:hypothetical protein